MLSSLKLQHKSKHARVGSFLPALLDILMSEKTFLTRIRQFVLAAGIMFSFVYLFLPFLTKSCSPLQHMAECLEETGIDPSRYYYTDVEQVQEGELYLRSVLEDQN